jgi:BirA family biotin operon repressor/biotin-[acetyl-CoA-carboxylase] ligase
MLKNTDMNITWLDIVDSTNNEAKRQIQSLNHMSVISSFHQTAGRGQRGNSWRSEKGMNLTFSIVIKYGADGYGDLNPSNQFLISKVTSLAVTEFLKRFGIDAQIKWPNDIYVKNKKIAGILIEHALQGNTMAYSIIGIGLNVNQLNFDSNLFNPTSIRLESPGLTHLDLKDALNDFLNIFKDITENKIISEIDELYHSKLWRLDSKSTFVDYTKLPTRYHEGPVVPIPDSTRSSIEFSGRIIGVSSIGELLIEDSSSFQIRRFSFKEIGYII